MKSLPLLKYIVLLTLLSSQAFAEGAAGTGMGPGPLDVGAAIIKGGANTNTDADNEDDAEAARAEANELRRAAAADVNGGAGSRPRVQSGGNQEGGGTQPTIGCPFYRDTATVANLITTTRTHLTSLVNRARQDQEHCGAVSANLDATNTAFERLTANAGQGAFPVNPGDVACANYEATLRQQYNLAVAESNGTLPSTSSNQFSNLCSDRPDVLGCIQESYTSQIGSWDRRCRNQGLQNLNADTRQNLEAMTASIDALVSNADSCSSIGRESILQAGLQQATATASLAAGIGLPSLGISIVGRLLSSIASRIFNSNNPENFLRTLNDNNERPGVQCLFYDLQRTALGCETIENGAAPVIAASNTCETNISHLVEISDFSRQLNSRFEDPAATNSSDPAVVTRSRDYNRMFDEISTKINPHLELLDGVATSMSAPTASVTNRSQGRKLALLLAEYRSLNAPGSTPSDASIQEFVQKFANQGNNGVDLSDILQRHLSMQSGADQTFANNLANSAIRRVINSTSAESINIQNDLARAEQSKDHLSDALTAMVRVSRNRFADRIETLKNNWVRASPNTRNPAEKMALLNELFTMCMTTQGMSYFNGPQKIHLFSQARPNPKYQSACQMFQCPAAPNRPALFEPFDQNDAQYGNGATPVADKFARYQCAQNRRLNQKLNQLRQNIVGSGQICGN